MWVLQCLSVDLGVQASTLKELLSRFCVLLTVEAEEAERAGKTDFSHIGRAPQVFFDMWEEGKPISEFGRLCNGR